jgi:tight adherence protein C
MHAFNLLLESANLALALGSCIFVVVYMLGKIFLTSSSLDARLEEVRLSYGLNSVLNLKKTLENQFLLQKKKKQLEKANFRKRILDAILKNPFMTEENLKLSFEQAGWLSQNARAIFLGSKILFLILGVAIGYIITVTQPYFLHAPFTVKGILLCLMAFIGWILPNLYLKKVIKGRVDLIEKQFSDALDLMIICMQAGLGLNRAVDRVAKEMILFGKEISNELALTGIELEIMLDRRQALQNLYRRVPSSVIRNFSTTVLQSIQQGTPALQSLDILSKDIREARMQKAETKAAKLPSLLVIPLVIFVMPNIFIVLLGPVIVRLLNVT